MFLGGVVMKTKYFEIVCSVCGSKKVALVEYHNSNGDGMRLKCKECNAKDDL